MRKSILVSVGVCVASYAAGAAITLEPDPREWETFVRAGVVLIAFWTVGCEWLFKP